jgi:hypothetical protein
MVVSIDGDRQILEIDKSSISSVFPHKTGVCAYEYSLTSRRCNFSKSWGNLSTGGASQGQSEYPLGRACLIYPNFLRSYTDILQVIEIISLYQIG